MPENEPRHDAVARVRRPADVIAQRAVVVMDRRAERSTSVADRAQIPGAEPGRLLLVADAAVGCALLAAGRSERAQVQLAFAKPVLPYRDSRSSH